MENKTGDGGEKMSRLTIPCCQNCICLPMCLNRPAHDLFDCCKLLAGHWYKWIGDTNVHRKLGMRRAYNFTGQMNEVLKREFVPLIYHHKVTGYSGKPIMKETTVFTDANDLKHMPAKDVFYTIQEYEKIGIKLFEDSCIGDIVLDAIGQIHRRDE